MKIQVKVYSILSSFELRFSYLHALYPYRAASRGGGGRLPPNRNFFLAPFKYSLTWFLPNHMYNLCSIAWWLWHLCTNWQTLCVSH